MERVPRNLEIAAPLGRGLHHLFPFPSSQLRRVFKLVNSPSRCGTRRSANNSDNFLGICK